MDHQPAGIGHNEPPKSMAEAMADHYAAQAIVARHPDAFDKLGALLKLEQPEAADTPERETFLTETVKTCRATITTLEARKTLEKAPVLSAGRVLEAMFKTEVDKVTKVKTTAELKLLVASQRRAKEQQELRESAARDAREKAARDADAAAALDVAGHGKAADMVYEHAIRSERDAERHEARAAGPVNDLARSANAAGTTGLRTDIGYEVVNAEKLRATLGPLGRCFTVLAVEAAIRQYIAEHKRTATKGTLPVLAGVAFSNVEKSNVR